jgi:hypothetical protein
MLNQAVYIVNTAAVCLMSHTCKNFREPTAHVGLRAAGESEHLPLYHMLWNAISKPQRLL